MGQNPSKCDQFNLALLVKASLQKGNAFFVPPSQKIDNKHIHLFM
jgi:hypothetical protein